MIGRFLKRKRAMQVARLPDGIRVYAVGDVHGRADLLDRLLSRIDADAAARPVGRPIVLFVGDYIDRGPGSREVLDLLIDVAKGRETVFLRGNHDVFIANFIANPAVLRDWSKIGGLETLMSYGLQPSINADEGTQKELAKALAATMPASHVDFLQRLDTSFPLGGYFFVHAGVRPGTPLAEQSEEDMLWIRDEFLLHEEDFGKIVVHGHTPVRELDIRPNRINVDTGAYVTGRLTCVVLEGDRVEPL